MKRHQDEQKTPQWTQSIFVREASLAAAKRGILNVIGRVGTCAFFGSQPTGLVIIPAFG